MVNCSLLGAPKPMVDAGWPVGALEDTARLQFYYFTARTTAGLISPAVELNPPQARSVKRVAYIVLHSTWVVEVGLPFSNLS